MKAHLDASGNLTSVNGAIVPDIEVDTTPSSARRRLPPARSESSPPTRPRTARAWRPVSVVSLRAASNTLEIYRTGLTRGAEGSNQLVYVVDVTNRSNIRDVVFVNAHVGKLVNRYSLVHDALFRRVFERVRAPHQVWQEGDPFRQG